MSWTEVDSAVTSPAQTDIAYSTMQTRVYAMLDNLPSQHPHYSLVPNYINEAKDELLVTAIGMNRAVLDMLPRLQNWRWYDVTVANQNYLPLPERMLWLTALLYSKSTSAYDPSTTVLYPSNPWSEGDAADFGLLSRTTTGYPSMFHRAGGRVEFWPTPSSTPTDYRTQIVVEGVRMDKDLSVGADVLLMPPRMQLLVIDLAVVISMEKMGWDEAVEKRQMFEGKLTSLLAPGVKERVRTSLTTRVAGAPR